MVLELARRGGRRPVSVRQLADMGAVPYAFARSVARDLSSAGLVVAHRGVAGGLTLARGPGEITLLDILEATQGPIAVSVCVRDHAWCDRMGSCAVHDVWEQAGKLLEQYLASKDIASLVSRRMDGE